MTKKISFRLDQALKDEFEASTRSRGVQYFRAGAVRRIMRRGDGVWAEVSGSQTYQTGLRWWCGDPPDAVGFYCSCPAYGNFGPCKHLWALVLELDKRGCGPEQGLQDELELIEYEDGEVDEQPQSGFGWLGMTDSDLSELGKSELTDWAHTLPHLNLQARTMKPVAAWEQALMEFEYKVPTWKNPWDASRDRTWEIRYVLDVGRTYNYGKVRINTLIHRRLQSGQWGRAKNYVPGSTNTPELDLPNDQAIHASLQGAGTGGFGYMSAHDGYHLEAELCRKLLPQMASTGRLYAKHGSEPDPVPLVMDEGQPWNFRPQLTSDEESGELCLKGQFLRGDEVLAASEPELIMSGALLLHEGRLAFYTPREAEPQIGVLCMRDLRAPAEARERMMQILLGCPGYCPPEDTTLEEEVLPGFHLFVQAEEGQRHHSRNLACQVSANYAGQYVNVFDAGEFLETEAGGVIRRHATLESDALSVFLAQGGKRLTEEVGRPDHCVVAMGRLSALVGGLLSEGWTVEADGKLWRRAGGSSFSVRTGIDWFDLEGGIEFGEGQVASLPALLEAAKQGAKTVQLGDGTIGVLPDRWLESWGMLELAGKPKGDALRFAKNQGWLLDALLAERESVNCDAGFDLLKKRIANFKGLKSKAEPRSFQGELRAYQRTGLGWFEFLRDLGINGCLADDMGLGKTIQVLALFEARRLKRRRKGGLDLPSLVVAPRSVVFNWLDEIKRFTPKLRVLDYTGTDRGQRLAQADEERVDLIVTTYGTLRMDILELREREFDYVVLDEAQAIKNPRSQAAKAARLLQARHRMALSGTPIENHLGELWSLFEFLNPGMLGASTTFQRFAKTTGREQTDDDFSRLARALAPFFLRRTKEQVLPDLPEKTEQVLHCEFKPSERVEYDKLRDFYRKSLRSREEEVGLPKMKIQVLEALLRLRQAACHPGLIDRSRAGEDSAKLRVLLPMLDDICAEGHKALVFSQFTSLLGIVRKNLDERGMTYEYLDGRTRKRKEKVDRFQEDEDCPLFLISIKAGGNGLNLTKADYVFLLDPWWNPAVEAQAIDRVHRIGRDKPVFAYRLITTDTVEQKVVELQESKRRLADAILGQGNVGLRNMTRDDLELLLS